MIFQVKVNFKYVILILLRRFKCNDISTIVLFFDDLFAMEGHIRKFFWPTQ